MNGTNDRKLKMPTLDLKKKPSFELLKMIGDGMIQEITKHPFSKVKPPKGPKIEDIFIKGKQPKSLERKNNTAKQSNKKKKFKKKI
tara:strand:- start:1897 stop:2154 length:258 start_codon:yes stop_codon:yes gene_type:complete